VSKSRHVNTDLTGRAGVALPYAAPAFLVSTNRAQRSANDVAVGKVSPFRHADVIWRA
jgi:hypothetical protein